MTCHCLIFVGTRADLGPLGPVIAELADDPGCHLTLATGVAFHPEALRSELPEHLGALDIVAVADPVGGALDTAGITAHGGRLAAGMARLLGERHFDAAVVLGDRWELLYVVPALFLAAVPIVHLHGGEVTEGAIDDRVRHAVTKLADVHCVASPTAADRLRQLGEPEERIHHTGAPGLDRYRRATPLNDSDLADLLGVEPRRPLVLFTYHPVTVGQASVDEVADHARSALRAARALGGTVVATHPGMDHGRDEILTILDAESADPGVVVVPALGRHYPEVLAACDVVVGNSSSGIIEAATAGVPVVDIGTRQQGRERGPNVVHAEDGEQSVAEALSIALAAPGAETWPAANPYGDGCAAPRIRAAVEAAAELGRDKAFVDRKPT